MGNRELKMETGKWKVLFFSFLYFTGNLYAQETGFKSFSAKMYGGYSITQESSHIQKVGGHYDLGNSPVAGFGLAWFLTPNWSAEGSVSAGRYRINMTDGDYSSMQVLRDDIPLGRVWIAPVSLSIKYHINRWEAIKPYMGAGRTFMLFDKQDPGWAADAVEYHSRAALHIGLGTDYYVTDRWFVQLNLKHFLANRAKVHPDFTKSVGWKMNGQLKPDLTEISLGIGVRF